MTYEEFKDAVKIEQRIVDKKAVELTVSITANRRRRFPIEIISSANMEDLIKCENDLKLELWTFLQSEVGRTDEEVTRAYELGLRDGYQGSNDWLDILTRSYK